MSTAADSGKADIKTVGTPFIVISAIAQVVVLAGLLAFAKPTNLHFHEGNAVVLNVQLYNYYIGVTLMMFVGFGYLMTFLHRYGLGAVGFTMFITVLGMQLALLLYPLCHHGFKKFDLNLWSLLQGDFAVAAILISFGALIGKVNPTQLVILTIFESVFYALNTVFFLEKFVESKDVGGTITIHMFGAYFGLAASWILGQPAKVEKQVSSPVSDLFAFIGTVFLWLYWPSFVAGPLAAGTVESETAMTNTILALLGSTMCAFIFSAALSGKLLRPGDIQNATLAGGVGIGAVANFNITPFGALLIGCLAGVVSTIGYCKVQGLLQSKLGLHDSCGVHNLHGIPALFGAVCSVCVPAMIDQGPAGVLGEPLHQLGATVGTLLASILGGLVTGAVMKLLKNDAEEFDDRMWWEVADVESPSQNEVVESSA